MYPWFVAHNETAVNCLGSVEACTSLGIAKTMRTTSTVALEAFFYNIQNGRGEYLSFQSVEKLIWSMFTDIWRRRIPLTSTVKITNRKEYAITWCSIPGTQTGQKPNMEWEYTMRIEIWNLKVTRSVQIDFPSGSGRIHIMCKEHVLEDSIKWVYQYFYRQPGKI